MLFFRRLSCDFFANIKQQKTDQHFFVLNLIGQGEEMTDFTFVVCNHVMKALAPVTFKRAAIYQDVE